MLQPGGFSFGVTFGRDKRPTTRTASSWLPALFIG